MNLPLTFVPYDAARGVEITTALLDELASSDRAGAWIAERSREWLLYWRTSVGRRGFYPFDVFAAAYVRAPHHYRCARVVAWVHDPWLSVPVLRPTELLVTQRPDADERAAGTEALYCPAVINGFADRLRAWLLSSSDESSEVPR